MDILLFNPYYSQFTNNYSFILPAPPLGLMYLASYLRKNNLDCKIAELGIFTATDSVKTGKMVRFGITDEAIEKIVKEEKSKVVGLTCMYSIYYRDCIEIANTIKRVAPDVLVVLGGNHASSYWQQVLKHPTIDYVVIGEGEETFLELAKNILKGAKTTDIEGIAFRDASGQVKKTSPRALIKDLDSIPFPALDLIDFKRYLTEGNPFAMRSPVAAIISSRGCPGDCVYCTVKAVWGRSWRGRSPKNVVDEIELLYKDYSIREIAFLDDSASVDRKRWEGICDELIRRKLDIKWTTPNGIAHWTLTKEILYKMKKAGCYRITFGIESGHPQTRKFLGKPYSLTQARELIRYANRIGIWTICTNIIGFPYETIESIRATINFSKKSDTDFATFYLLIPQPTSDVYRYFKKEGLLNFDKFFDSVDFDETEFEKLNSVLNEIGSDTLYFKKEELNKLQKIAYRTFIVHRIWTYLLNPLKLIRKIHSMEEAHYILRLINMGWGIFVRTLNPLNRKTSDYLYSKSKATLTKLT
ncbi:MAG: cobalamin B12-binding domain-containing protein [Candidatus Omnitrophica bacterium]|nr:cobalamin B12-binding domain-containing protein [Candidatus Omnitrophota bacterium]